MADVTSDDIAGYAKYLKGQGASDQDIQGYTKYLSDHHGVDHPQAPQQNSWLDTQIPGGTPRGYIKGALNTLPTAGMVAGGAIGGMAGIPAAGPYGAVAGGVAGAGIGGGLGESLKNLGESALGEEKTRSDIYIKPVSTAAQSALAEITGQGLVKGLGAAAETKAGQYVLRKGGQLATKLVSSASGVSEQEINTLAKHTDEVTAMAKSSDNDAQEMADQLRQKLNTTIQTKRQQLNGQISSALKTSDSSIESQPIVDALEGAKSKLNPRRHADQVSQIDDLIAEVKASSKDGKIAVEDAHDLKEWLRDNAKGSYQKGGQIFTVGDKAARAAKSGAAVARGLIDEAAPQVAEANASLSRLHDIEDVMNRNMLAEGKPAASLYAAGSGANPANAKILKQLGDETGTDMLGEAQKLTAARTFGKPSLLPVDATGKSLTRMGAAGGVGYLIGGVPGAVIAQGLTSPAAIKAAVVSGRALGPVAAQAAKSAPSLLGLSSLEGAKSVMPDVAPDATPIFMQPTKLNDGPLKGTDKWAQDGLEKLNEHDPSVQLTSDLKDDPKIKDLLVQASDLKPGSKAMDVLVSKIKQRVKK